MIFVHVIRDCTVTREPNSDSVCNMNVVVSWHLLKIYS